MACIFLPINHYAGNTILRRFLVTTSTQTGWELFFFVKGTQENLMKARDERVGLMNEVGNHLDFLALA